MDGIEQTCRDLSTGNAKNQERSWWIHELLCLLPLAGSRAQGPTRAALSATSKTQNHHFWAKLGSWHDDFQLQTSHRGRVPLEGILAGLSCLPAGSQRWSSCSEGISPQGGWQGTGLIVPLHV